MNVKNLKNAFNRFSDLEFSRTQKREESFNHLIQNIIGIRASCIPQQALSVFDKTPFNKLPSLLDKLSVDPLANSDLKAKLSVVEKEQGRDLSKLNLVLVQETIQSSKRWQNMREVAPENKTNATIEKKGKNVDGPSFER
ncbi:hypothetical protein [Vibrio splendidus]|uniref:hypothetical protein n=1 Tax=Vibrio splendidus TaxID=29497 RepID=UPI003D0DBF65